MDAKELRIGNYILDYEAEPEVSIYWKVEEIQRLSNDKALNQTLGVTYRKGSCWTCDPEPIPLTEEWLVKFGFTCHWDDDYDNHVFSLIRSGNYDDVIIDPSWVSQTECNSFVIAHFDYEMDLEIKHVHQLQNLYLALTNEELRIK
mgnify:CR=1 FL=1|tara:strand:- start:38 stop:475 length:438 start_codon:yes stop_codon:yes gene_type:complete